MSRSRRESERARLERVFREYRADERYRRRWDPANPGNARIEREREESIRRLLLEAGLWPPTGYRILDLGCGTGRPLARFVDWGANPEQLVGVDLLAENVEIARQSYPVIRFVAADATALDLPNEHFRLVVAFTVFSSVLDGATAGLIASEIDRVLEPGGSVLWYDYRLSHPLNRHTRGVPKRQIRDLFGTYRTRLDAITLVPQIARRLGPLTGLYPILVALPVLRTHYVGLLAKPD